MPLTLRTRAAIVTLALLLLAALVTQAFALTGSEAGKVVALIERLDPELGPLAYDREVAEDWFARDGLIAKAGFTRAGWRIAFDATLCGYLANLPKGELDARFGELRVRVKGSAKMSPEQRAAAMGFVAEHEAEIERLRAAGRADAEAVRPFMARLRLLLPQDVAGE